MLLVTGGCHVSQSVDGPKKHAVLVVDDDLAVATVLARLLRAHEVTVLTDATEALALIASGQAFDAILSDLMMPGMSGMEFYDELSRRDAAMARRVVFVTGGTFTKEASAFMARVKNPRVDKPFDAKVVRAVIEGVMK